MKGKKELLECDIILCEGTSYRNLFQWESETNIGMTNIGSYIGRQII